MFDPDLEVNVNSLSDPDLIRFAADCMRPTPDEHSVASSRMYGIAAKLAIETTAQRRAERRASLTLVPGGKDVH